MRVLKNLIKSLANHFNYHISRDYTDRTSPDFNCKLDEGIAAQYSQWTSPTPIFTPWAGESDFMRLHEEIERYTYVSPDRCYMLSSFARSAALLPGSFAEAGVCKGGTALMLSRIIAEHGRTFDLFDSFQGLPKETETHDNFYKQGQMAANESAVRDLLKEFDDFTRFHVGWIPQTFTGLESNEYCFVHVDVDLYRPALDCCEFFYPRLVRGGMMIFDDYGFPSCRGEKDAVDEFFSNKPEKPIALPTGQALVIRLATDSWEQSSRGTAEASRNAVPSSK